MAIVGVWLKAGRVSISPEIVVATKAVMQKLICGCKMPLCQHSSGEYTWLSYWRKGDNRAIPAATFSYKAGAGKTDHKRHLSQRG